MAAQQHHPHALPPTLSPDDLDALSELYVVLTKVRAGIHSSSSSGISAATTQQQLSFKDVPGATDGLKHKLQRARAQIRDLPDMHRSIDEQRSEIATLEARIHQQRALLDRLRDGGVKYGKDGHNVKMENS